MIHGEGRPHAGGPAAPTPRRRRASTPPLVQLLMIFGFGAMGSVAFAATNLLVRPGTVPNETLHLVLLCSGAVLSVCLGSTIYLARASTLKAVASEAAHRRLEHVLRAATRVAIVATDAKGVIRIFNEGAERMLGFSGAMVVNRQTPEVFHLPSDIAARSEELRPTLDRRPGGFEVLVHGADGEEPKERHWSLRRRDGRSLRASVSVTAMRNPAGRIEGYLFVARDVTAEENALSGLREAKRVAEAASESKSQFVANISHEIRTPMTAILGYADLLEDDSLDPAVRAEHVRTIKRNGDHLLAIINDILDMERLNSGKLPIEAAEVPLGEIADEVVALMRVRSNDKGLPLRLELRGPLPRRIRTDPLRFKQILMNLVGNAIKFTESGEVTVAISTTGEGGIRPMLAVEVSDSGLGIRPELLDRLFEPFTQADPTSTRRHGGSGLGLAISRRLARMLGGDLRARSVFGQGSVFTLTLPLEGASGEIERRSTPRDPGDAVSPAASQHRRSAPPLPAAAAAASPAPSPPRTPSSIEIAAPSRSRGIDAMLATMLADPNGLLGAASPPRPPAATPSESPTPPPAAAGPRPLAGCRVLLVEDGPDNRRLLSLHLARGGAEVLLAEDGQQAVDRLRRDGLDRGCDLVVMDMQMPGLDGYEATRQLRRIGFRRPIIALTAHASTTDREKCLACGCDDYASKPIDAKAFIALCRQWIPASAAAIAA
jgi:PAS domain S-box-containing protein